MVPDPPLLLSHTARRTSFSCEHLLRIFQDLAAEREQEFAATFGTIKNLKSRSRPDNSSRKEHEDRQTFCLPVPFGVRQRSCSSDEKRS